MNALGLLEHEFHDRVALWVTSPRNGKDGAIATCAITELGQLPGWVKAGRQTTDGHLAQLARAHDVVLATLDEQIPGAFVIPG